MSVTSTKNRAERTKGTDYGYVKARKRIIATAEVCAICGQPLHPELSYPHPLSTTVDHITPIARGGKNTDPKNMQAVHFICNVKKGDSLPDTTEKESGRKKTISNRLLPASRDWKNYKA